MSLLWEVKGPHDSYAQLYGDSSGFTLTTSDGAEGSEIKISSEQLLDLAYTIYEELG